MSYVDYLRAALVEPDWVLLQRLAEIAARAGMSLYIVGGPVRDCLLRRAVTDLDLTTEGDAHTLARTLARELGGAWKKFERFGTAKLTLPGRDSPIDLATTRTETYAHPGALPAVTRGTIETDLFRRDFTINAMAIRLNGEQQGTLIDRHGGESDLYSGLLRVLHDRSFEDDPTRLFRGVRFEQRFNFVFAGDTAPRIAAGLPAIDRVSGDRIRHELELIFGEAQPLKALARLDELSLLRQIDPDLRVDGWIAERFQAQAAPFDPFTCWAWLTCRLSESSLTRFSQRVNLARADIVDLVQVRALRDAAETLGRLNSRSGIYHALENYHERSLRAALTGIERPAARAAIVLYLNELREVRTALNGTRLQELGLARGPLIGRILVEVQAAVLDGVIATPQQEEEYAQQIIAREGRGA
jgi:tRNA nucleotidyltransferase (CCA-adding enzyme)